MIFIAQYGWKIRTYKAATIVGKNLGIRDRYDYTSAMLHHSLFTRWLQNNGMQTNKADDSTRDIICMDFQFGLRSYEEEKKHIREMRKTANKIEDEEEKAEKLRTIDEIEQRADQNKHLYKKMSKADIREYLYINGADITYSHLDKKNNTVVDDETIHYKMLYRSPSKAKAGMSLWIREELYDKAYEWMTMGIGARMPLHGAKIVELAAYQSLSASAIEATFQLDIDSVLLIRDQESMFHTTADIVRVEDYETYVNVENPDTGKKEAKLVTKKKCVVRREETDVVNVAWDGQALIEPSALPDGYETAGMALLRNRFFKACAFKTRIQQFFRDYCEEHGLDYETFEVTDYFGKKHLAKNIKMIVSENGTKFKKFSDLLGGDFESAYEYWKERVREDGCIWGIVKRDHTSKLGDVQRLSYQGINSLPTTKDDIFKITENSVQYVESLKFDNDEYIRFLRKNANIINSYDMFADLYEQNPGIANTKFFRFNRSKIINDYVSTLKKGKITVNGDNLTVLGNPYGQLLHVVGEDWTTDPTLRPEEGTIQVYTKRFEDGEYLCGIRYPENSANNIAYYHNIKHTFMDRYFEFSDNILAVNCIQTDVQARMNGMDSTSGSVIRKLIA